MEEFVAGQWVECVSNDGNILSVGEFYQVTDMKNGYVCVDGYNKWYANRFRPVSWQVGRTYKTTLEGVTATITGIEGHVIRGVVANRSGGVVWDIDGTGRCGGCNLEDKTAPHLTPYLAYPEPAPAVETVLGEQSREEANDVELLNEHQRLIEKAILEQSGHVNLSRYHRTINGATLDLYDLAQAYGIESHRVFHAVKKLVMAGRRGHKDREQDLREAIASIESELRKMKGGA